jgi:hypothetical protein
MLPRPASPTPGKAARYRRNGEHMPMEHSFLMTASIPVQRRAAQRTVRCNRWLGVTAYLTLQDNMGSLLRSCMLHAGVSQGSQIDTIEQSLAFP